VACGRTGIAVRAALSELRAILRNHQTIRGHLFYLAANGKLEQIGQESLGHEPGLLPKHSIGCPLRNRAGASLGVNVVSCGIDPAGTTLQQIGAEMPYAFRISSRTLLFVAVNLPPGRIMEGERVSPERFGSTDATSNDSEANCDWA
jgi:hypothetical protein